MSAKFLVTVDVHVDDLHRCPDLLSDFRAERIDVLYVREVFSRDTMASIRARLETKTISLQHSPQEDANPAVNQNSIFGVSITPSNLYKDGPPLEHYLDAAVRFRSDCRSLFAGCTDSDYEGKIVDTFHRLAGGRDVALATTRDGRHYTPSTVRCIPDDCRIPIHVDNYILHQPVAAPLTEIVEPALFSFFVPFAKPEAGGELCVYDLVYEDPRAPLDPIGNVDVAVLERDFKRETHAPNVGDLFIFNGGKYYHRVAHVRSHGQMRWTIGGFLAFAKADHRIYFWG